MTISASVAGRWRRRSSASTGATAAWPASHEPRLQRRRPVRASRMRSASTPSIMTQQFRRAGAPPDSSTNNPDQRGYARPKRRKQVPADIPRPRGIAALAVRRMIGHRGLPAISGSSLGRRRTRSSMTSPIQTITLGRPPHGIRPRQRRTYSISCYRRPRRGANRQPGRLIRGSNRKFTAMSATPLIDRYALAKPRA